MEEMRTKMEEMGKKLDEKFLATLSDEQKKKFSDRTAVRRWGQPIDMVGPAMLLASDAGAYVTGHVLPVDGGNTVSGNRGPRD